MWLPSLQAGMSGHRHDGDYQAVDGSIVDINSNSYQYGLGAGAVAAGTTPRPGLVAQFHMADALFLPKAAEKTAWARGHAASATINQQLLTASSAYVELLDAYQEVRIVEESRDRMHGLAKITGDFAQAGQGLKADSERMQTEVALLNSRLLGVMEHRAVASARLARAVSLDGAQEIVPQDLTAVPLDLVRPDCQKTELITIGLSSRPELKEAQALVAAACDAYRREKYAPLVPSVLLGFSTGSFGGGLGNSVSGAGGRYDLDALMMWEVRNLGLGEQAARRERSAQVQQARFNNLRMLDQVAQEVAESAAQVEFRRQQIDVTRSAIQTAEDAYRHNLERIREAQGLPIEVLQSVQALENAQLAYLRAITDYNLAQLRLQWSLGWPIT
jgi:outer membrane protein TolC